MKLILATIVSVVLFSSEISGHGRLLEPPQRSSMWRDPRFENLMPPNYDDGGLWCAGVKQDFVPQECGVCGDPVAEARPRPNENGGTFGKGILAGNYTKGQVIDVKFELTATHNGYFSAQICDDVTKELEPCFWQREFLPLGNNGSFKYDVTHFQGLVTTTVTLPADLTCDRCVFRIYYRTAKDWGECGDGTGDMGCGPQELVLNCADISIH